MPRRKPLGWPRYMVERKLKSGTTAYYWVIPTWAKRNGCPLAVEALGTDYADAKKRCDELLNADLTDAQLRALSGHKTDAMTALYTKATMRQRRSGARKRLEERTKGGNLSK